MKDRYVVFGLGISFLITAFVLYLSKYITLDNFFIFIVFFVIGGFVSLWGGLLIIFKEDLTQQTFTNVEVDKK